MKKNIFPGLFLSLLLLSPLHFCCLAMPASASSLALKYFDTGEKRILQATLIASTDTSEFSPAGTEINFFAGTDPKVLLGKVNADENGVARYEISGDMKAATSPDGMWIFSSEFAGNDTIEGSFSEVTVRNIKLEMILTEADSIKTVTLRAVSHQNGGEEPVSGETVTVVVPRMFSFLTIGELTLDANGEASVEFPSDLPGDKDGNLIISARMTENSTYGNVEKSETIRWGTPVDYSVPVTHRALWTKIAPRWMVITLSILLIGVWAHYLYAIISLVRIRKDADRKKEKDQYRI